MPATRFAAAPLAIAMSLALSGCWKEDLATLPVGSHPFEPAISAPAGWWVSPLPVDLSCPDGQPARFHLLHPEEAPLEPGPAAILFHAGAFDFVYTPMAADPLAGPHFSQPSRLEARWSLDQVFTTLGMRTAPDPDAAQQGAVAVALAERGVPVLLPANCWGDLWHNRRGLADNDFAADLFARDGRTSAEWALQLLTEPEFATELGLELPVQADPQQIYLLGLGEGGRAVAELLALNPPGEPEDEGEEPALRIAGALTASHSPDLTPFFDDPVAYDGLLTGLHRIFPGGAEQARATALDQVPWPERLAFLFSADDPSAPPDALATMVERVEAHPGGWAHEAPGSAHLGDDLELARQAIDFLLGP